MFSTQQFCTRWPQQVTKKKQNKKHLFIYYYYYFFPLLSVLSAWRLYYSLNFFFFFRGIQMRARGTATCRFFQFLVSPHHHFPTARLYTPFAQQPGAIINRVMQSSSSRSKTLFFFGWPQTSRCRTTYFSSIGIPALLGRPTIFHGFHLLHTHTHSGRYIT